MNRSLLLIPLLTVSTAFSRDSDQAFVVEPFTEPGLFTRGIEGPACDREGNLYVVSFGEKRTIGKVTPEGKAEAWVQLPEGSAGNGIRFNRAGEMFVADYTGHNILKIDLKTKGVSVFVHEPKMHQPNDLAIGPDGTLYASDPDWKNKEGALWRISPDGTVTLLADGKGTTNGIEVSPDGKTLYVTESRQHRILAYDLSPDGIANERVLIEFEDHNLDGMRCDVDGNLYITRHGAGLIVKLSPAGKILKKIELPGSMPSNLCFGGPDGRTVYVTEVENQQVLRFRADRPGLAWQRWQEAVVRVSELDDRIRIEIDGELFTEWRHREWVAPYFHHGDSETAQVAARYRDYREPRSNPQRKPD